MLIVEPTVSATRRGRVRLARAALIAVALIAATLGMDASIAAQSVPPGDRYDTAALLATEAFPDGTDTALVASGENYPDALTAAPLAAHLDAAIVLTQHDQVPAATTNALTELGVADVIVLGGDNAVSQTAFNALAAGPWQTTRYAGTPATETVQIFFANPDLGDVCEDVFPVDRQVVAPAVATGALTALLEGPSPNEEAAGYTSWFSSETAGYLNDVTIDEGAARADFRDFSEITPNASTACGSANLLGELDATLMQFPTVDSTRYSFDGSESAFYTWLQRSVPD